MHLEQRNSPTMIEFIAENKNIATIAVALLAAIMSVFGIYLNFATRKSLAKFNKRLDLERTAVEGRIEILTDQKRDAVSSVGEMLKKLQQFRSFVVSTLRNAEVTPIDSAEVEETLEEFKADIDLKHADVHSNCPGEVDSSAHRSKHKVWEIISDFNSITKDVRSVSSISETEKNKIGDLLEELRTEQDFLRDYLITEK